MHTHTHTIAVFISPAHIQIILVRFMASDTTVSIYPHVIQTGTVSVGTSLATFSATKGGTITIATNLPSDKWLPGCSSTWALSFGFLVMAPNFAGIKAHNTHRQTSDQQCKCVLSRSQVYVPYVVSLAGFSHLSVTCSMEKGLAGAFFFSQVRSGYVERV